MESELTKYFDVKRELKQTCSERIQNLRANLKNELIKVRNDPNQFWKQIKTLGRKTNVSTG